MNTESELLFESFCRIYSIQFQRVPETTELRPDYELVIEGQQILAEIKQFDPIAEERKAMERRARGEQVALGSKPGERLRRAIHFANTQLKKLLAGRLIPALLVVYNNTPCSLHTRPYAVMTAMQGIDLVDMLEPANLNLSPTFGDTRSGPGWEMRADANTSTSAVAVLRDVDINDFQLAIYHNRHVTSQLEPRLMRFPGVVQFRLPEGVTNSVDAQWVTGRGDR
jgi:hypothetical protein